MKNVASAECFNCRKDFPLSVKKCPKCGWSGMTMEMAERWCRRDGTGYLKRASK